jgi:hypothetical protein
MQNGQSRESGNIGYTRRRITQYNMRWIPLCAHKHKETLIIHEHSGIIPLNMSARRKG